MIKSKKGITLIALIITIIVLLILAGVSISLVLGDDGVVNKAAASSQKTKVAQEKESISLAWSGLLGDKLVDKIEITDTKFEQELKNNGENVEVSYDAENNYLVFFKDTAHTYLVDKLNGSVNELTKFEIELNDNETITEDNVGIYLGYKVSFVSGEDDTLIWRLFYLDNNYVYLISSTATGENVINPYIIQPYLSNYQDGAASVDENLRFLNQKFFDVWGEENCTYATAKAMAHLLDQDVWGKYKDEAGNAKYVIGCPTLELIINSINMARGTSYDFESTRLGYRYAIDNQYGSIPATWNKGIYTGNRHGWLASPYDGGYSQDQLKYYRMCQVYAESVDHDEFSSWGAIDTGYVGLRPVVMIPKARFVSANYVITNE